MCTFYLEIIAFTMTDVVITVRFKFIGIVIYINYYLWFKLKYKSLEFYKV